MKKLFLTLSIAIASYSLAFAQWTNGMDIYNTNTGKVGIGTSIPATKLHVVGAGIFSLTSSDPYNTVQTALTLFNGAGNNGAGTQVNLSVGNATSYINSVIDGLTSSSGSALTFGTPSSSTFGAERMRITSAGNVGIGTINPTVKLAVDNGSASINNNVIADLGGQLTISNGYGNQNGAVRLNLNNGGAVSWIKGVVTGANTNSGSAMVFGVASNTADGAEAMRLTSSGNLLLGKNAQDNQTYKLDIGGKARANEIVVNSDGADFVFEPEYDLPKLSDVKSYIDKYHHLPEIPSAQEMRENGMSVGEFNTKLLQKVEELTLHLIEQQKVNQSLQKQINQLATNK